MSLEPSYLQLKSFLKLVIYGAYQPEASMKRLEALRDCLRAEGYSQANRVSDMDYPLRQQGESPEAYFVRKSNYWIENTDVNFFVFMGGKSSPYGVTSELVHACTVLSQEKLPRCVLFVQRRHLPKLGTQIHGRVKYPGRELNQQIFTNYLSLCILARAKAFEYVVSSYNELRKRFTQ